MAVTSLRVNGRLGKGLGEKGKMFLWWVPILPNEWPPFNPLFSILQADFSVLSNPFRAWEFVISSGKKICNMWGPLVFSIPHLAVLGEKPAQCKKRKKRWYEGENQKDLKGRQNSLSFRKIHFPGRVIWPISASAERFSASRVLHFMSISAQRIAALKPLLH